MAIDLKNYEPALMQGAQVSLGAEGDYSSILFNKYGRVSTSTDAGAAITLDSSFTRGEAWELRYTSSKSNTQVQGIFMEMRTSVANTSTIRGMEIKAAQEGAVAVGVLEGGNFVAQTRSTTTGNITNMYGVTGEINHNSDAYTGTVTEMAGVRSKVTLGTNATVTTSTAYLALLSQATGGKSMNSVWWVKTDASVTSAVLFDVDISLTGHVFDFSAESTAVEITAASASIPANTGYLLMKVASTTYRIPVYANS